MQETHLKLFSLFAATALLMAACGTDSSDPVYPDNNDQIEAPDNTEPEVTEPEVTEPEVTEPEVTEPEINKEHKDYRGAEWRTNHPDYTALPDSDWLWAEEITPEMQEQIDSNRGAIQHGLDLGQGILVEELNKLIDELPQSKAAGARFAGVDAGEKWREPRTDFVCPDRFSQDQQVEQTVRCRQLVEEAIDNAYGRVEDVLAENPVQDERFADPRFADENGFWAEQGVVSAIDNQAFFALEHVRETGICDGGLAPVAEGQDHGVEAGRQLFIEQLNRRLSEMGFASNYPNQGPIEVCSVNGAVTQVAFTRSVESIVTYVAEHPACGNYEPANSTEADWKYEYNDYYEIGVEEGIEAERSVANEVLFRVVPCNTGDPLVLDLDGDGVNAVKTRVDFDLFGNGEAVRTQWVTEDAFLAIDRNANGVIDNGSELFTNNVAVQGWQDVRTGFENLARYDANNDGQVDAADPIYAELLVWQDRNANGVSEADELQSLEAAGVAAISVRYEAFGMSAMPFAHGAAFIRDAASALATGALEGQVKNAWFNYGKAY
ncbi:hypothetical protein KKB55_17140 [Myxococcota bacterium]|nr:hypothetical protein [Myxococcota bacterium]MBU1899470.1 hypothetical protein [Myxococcota bacterium]